MKIYITLIIGILIIVTGCSTNEKSETIKPAEMNPEDLPEVPAFENEFTREFLQSVEPVREGYYPFLSKSESFTMDFPEDMEIEQRSHTVGPENRSETVEIRNVDKNANVHIGTFMRYYRFMSSEENSKRQMSASADMDLNFKRIETDYENQYLDVAEFQYDENNYTILALVWNEAQQQIQISVMARCLDSEEKDQCEPLTNVGRENIIEQLKSIELIPYESN